MPFRSVLWRMAGSSTRSLLGCSRRRMSGKRLLIGVLCTVCITLGVYIKFFNRESADSQLVANRNELPAVAAKPNFRFKSMNNPIIAAPTAAPRPAHEPRDDDVEHEAEVGNNERPAERTFNEQLGEKRTEPADVKAPDGGGETNAVKLENEGDNGPAKETEPQNNGDKEVSNDAPHQGDNGREGIDQGGDVETKQKETAVDGDAVPIVEHVEGEEEDSEVRDAGGDAGEHSDDVRNGDGGTGVGEDGGGGERGGDAGRAGGRGPHGFNPFDWDKWVKDNELVELGNIWGYCDDENPPVIGKVLLLPDEEKGGLKNVIVFNITTEYDIVMGRVEVNIDYNDHHMYSKVFDLEDLEEEGDFFKCPIAKGDHYFFREQHISSLVPKGRYYGEARMLDQNDKTVLCSTMHLHIK